MGTLSSDAGRLQEARGSYFGDILAVGAAWVSGEWPEDSAAGDPVLRRDQLKDAYAVAPPQPDERVLEALRDGNGPRAALPPPGPSMLLGVNGSALAVSSSQPQLGNGSGVVSNAPTGDRGPNGASSPATVSAVIGVPNGNGSMAGKGGVENGVDRLGARVDGDGNKRDLSWYVNQNLSVEERDGVTECPIDKTT
jgi:hypothetical protein